MSVLVEHRWSGSVCIMLNRWKQTERLLWS